MQVRRTPTFFVNGRNLPGFGQDQLAALVAEEVAKKKPQADATPTMCALTRRNTVPHP